MYYGKNGKFYAEFFLTYNIFFFNRYFLSSLFTLIISTVNNMNSQNKTNSLKVFLRTEPLNKIAISRAFHEMWKYDDIKTEDSDCNYLLNILKELTSESSESIDNDRKQHLKGLQNIDKVLQFNNIFIIFIEMMIIKIK